MLKQKPNYYLDENVVSLQLYLEKMIADYLSDYDEDLFDEEDPDDTVILFNAYVVEEYEFEPGIKLAPCNDNPEPFVITFTLDDGE